MKDQGRRPRAEPKSRDTEVSEALAWPANRFLQVHFEEIHLGIASLREELVLQRQLLEDLRRALLSRSRRPATGAKDSMPEGLPFRQFPDRKN